MKKRLLSLLLTAVMLLSAAACGETDTDKEQEQEHASVTTAPPTIETTEGEELTMAQQRSLVADKLPAQNFDGETFTALIREVCSASFYSEEETGEPVEDMLYRRDRNVSERFNVQFSYNFISALWADRAAYMDHVRQSIMSDDISFMLGDGCAAYIAGLAGEGLTYNLNDLEYLNPKSPWWFPQLTEELTINGKCYFISGDLSVYSWQCIWALIFNKQLVENYQFDDLYTVVREGNWTLDKLSDLTKAVYTDVNNNGTKDVGDIFGLTLPLSNNVDALPLILDCPFTVKDSDGYPALNLDNPRFADMTEKLYALFFENPGVYCAPETLTIGAELRDAFQNNEAVLTNVSFGWLEALRTMETDFGIIPYPKYDENQRDYISVVADDHTLYFMPVNIGEYAEFASIITEALCAESYRIVIPEYYEKALKTKSSRDNDSEEMIDLMRDTITFNFGAVYSIPMGQGFDYGPSHILRVTLKGNNANFVSQWEKLRKSSLSRLEDLLEAYE
ncbi:MAG: hypothetical protein IJA85_07820 [Clostridia bacterium]|nr:hypothetical protein [Clostridia bacterium]